MSQRLQVINDLSLYPIELESSLDESRDEYAELYESAPLGYFTLNEQGTITNVNAAGASLLGLKKHALLNKIFLNYIFQDCQSNFDTHFQATLDTMSLQTCEVKLGQKKVTYCHAKIVSKAVVNSLTGKRQVLACVTDMSERIRQETLLHQNRQKLNLTDRSIHLGELACSMAFEINQPLAVISNYLHGCIRRLESGSFDTEDLLYALNQALKQSQRTSEFVSDMKNVSMNNAFNYEPACINALIHEIISLVNAENTERHIKIQYQANHDLPLIMLDKIHMQQALLNIIRSMLESIREHCTLYPELHIDIVLASKNLIEICLKDNGPGIPPQILDNFFNSQSTSKNYGIGLALGASRRVIEAHGGEITLTENHPGGSIFKITLSPKILISTIS